jgi:HSP20 family protein
MIFYQNDGGTMLTLWNNLNEALALMRPDLDQRPKTTYQDKGTEVIVQAEVPGFSEKDIQISIDQDVLTLKGKTENSILSGPTSFTHSFYLPQEIDVETTTASVKNGILQINLPKLKATKPRQISVTGPD